MPLLLLIAAVMFLASKSDDATAAPSTGLGDDGTIEMSCDEAISRLPPEMRVAVATAIHSGIDAANLQLLADALEKAASLQHDPYLRAALVVAAYCVQDRALVVSGMPPATSTSSSSSPGSLGFAPGVGPGAPAATPSAPSSSPSTASTSFGATGLAPSAGATAAGTVPSSTLDGSTPIFGRMDASPSQFSAARVGATYAAAPQPGTALRR